MTKLETAFITFSVVLFVAVMVIFSYAIGGGGSSRAAKAKRIDTHCDLMRTNLRAIDEDAAYGGQVSKAAAIRFADLQPDNFRVVRLCTDSTPFEFCTQDSSPACIHRSVTTMLHAWSW